MNRKKILLLNTIVIISSTIINIIFGMWEVRLLIQKFGSTVNGLMQTGNQVLGYLALIEAGFGAAYIYSFYEPLAKNDCTKLSELYVGFKKSINKVVIKMLIAATIISIIYPFFLLKNNLSYFYILSIFVLLSAKAIVPYLITLVPKNMIIVRERKYIVELISCLTRVITYLSEILIMLYTDMPLQILLVVCIFVTILSGFIFKRIMKNLYGDMIDESAKPDLQPLSLSNSVLIHNISGIVFNSTDNIIISIFFTLQNVTIYSSYNLAVNQATMVFKSIFDGTIASMGIKLANKDSNSYYVYRKLLLLAYYISAIITVVYTIMINSFIELWIGKKYQVSFLCCLLFGYVLYYGIIFSCLSVPRDASGLYKESRNYTIVQAAVNLAITITLTPFLGITGALLGTFIARAFVTIPCTYYIVDKKVFPEHQSKWYELIYNFFLILLLSFLGRQLLLWVENWLTFNPIICFILSTGIVTAFVVIVVTIFYLLIDKDFIKLIQELTRTVRIKFKVSK